LNKVAPPPVSAATKTLSSRAAVPFPECTIIQYSVSKKNEVNPTTGKAVTSKRKPSDTSILLRNPL
jgi:hypothetical protein